MKRVAIIGIQGVPAQYGGFESLVENIIGEECMKDMDITVFCSSLDMPCHQQEYKGCHLRYIPLHANGIQSIPYDIVAMLRTMWGRYNTLLILGTSGCLFLPIVRLLSGKRLVVNIDGLEHRREKWGRMARMVLRNSERMAVRFAHDVIADNDAIRDYVTDTYRKHSHMIAYGGDHALREVSNERQREILDRYHLTAGEYAVTVCRIEPENNCHIILEAFESSGHPLVFVGNWQRSEYSRHLHRKYFRSPGILLIDSVYDLDVLYTLRSNARCYVHGHSAGGTNPSLVEAMYFGIPILAYDVIYNRCTTHQAAYYFKDVDSLRALLARTDLDGSVMAEIAAKDYTWSYIARQYADIL